MIPIDEYSSSFITNTNLIYCCKSKMNPADLNVDRVSFASLYFDRELVVALQIVKKIVRNKMPVNISNHFLDLRSLQYRQRTHSDHVADLTGGVTIHQAKIYDRSYS